MYADTDFYFMKEKKPFKFSIRAKTIVISLALAIIVTEIAVTFYAIIISKRNNVYFNNFADGLSGSIAETINVDDFKTVKNKVKPLVDNWVNSNDIVFSDAEEDKVNEYLSIFDTLESDNEFTTAKANLLSFLQKMHKTNLDNYVDCAYIGYVDVVEKNGQKIGISVYLVDSDEEEPCPTGLIDPIYDMNKDVLTDPGKGFPAYRTNTDTYGQLLTSGKPIRDSIKEENEEEYPVIGYAFVDIQLRTIRKDQAGTIIRLTAYMCGTVAILTIVVVLVVHFMFSKPVRKLAAVARSFDSQDPEKSHEAFENLEIKTYDELTELSIVLKNMEKAVRDRIEKLTETNNALKASQEQALKMTTLANRDSLTGVKSKTAYDSYVTFTNEQIEKGEASAFGLVMIDLNDLKKTNDSYGHDAGDEALIKLAHTICLVFKHSPVYRVGGDEFIVILRNDDFNNHEALIEEFKERIYSIYRNHNLQIQERISAAIGYSEFDQEKDRCIEDVIKRADKEMYSHKKKMKETI